MGKHALIIHYPTGGMCVGQTGFDPKALGEIGCKYIKGLIEVWGWSKDELREYVVEDDTDICRVYDATLGKDIAEWDSFYKRGWLCWFDEGRIDLAVLAVE